MTHKYITLHREPTAAGMAALGIGTGLINDFRQVFQQERLNRQTTKQQKALMDYQMQKQLEMWEKTGYKPQMEQIRKAGLNPALLYGMSGGGAQTIGGSIPGGTGAHAPTGGGEIPGIMTLGLQMELQKAQIKNIEADTKKKEVEAGESGSRIDLNKIKLAWDKIDTEIKNQTKEDAIREVWYRADKMAYEANIAEADSAERTSEETIHARKQEILSRAAQAIIQKDQAELLKNKTAIEIEQIKQQIANTIKELELKGQQVDNDTIRTKFETNLGNRMSIEAVRALGNIINMYVTKKTGSVDNQNR